MTLNLLATVNLPSTTGMAEDDVVQSFAFTAPDDFDTFDADLVRNKISAFYNTVATDALISLNDLLSPEMARNTACPVRIYNVTGHLDGSPHGSPTWDTAMGLNTPASTDIALPGEVAVVLTLRGANWDLVPVEVADGADADSAPDRPRSRHSGRFYFGKLNADCIAMADGAARPSASVRDTLRLAYKKLVTDMEANAWTMCVWSRKNATFYGVSEVSTDNAFDTQRRRGTKATHRDILDVVA